MNESMRKQLQVAVEKAVRPAVRWLGAPSPNSRRTDGPCDGDLRRSGAVWATRLPRPRKRSVDLAIRPG